MVKLLCVSMLVAAAAEAIAEENRFDNIYTLYRSSVLDPTLRIHIATFDAEEGAEYNAENCQLAARLLLSQEGAKTLSWCEAGSFQK